MAFVTYPGLEPEEKSCRSLNEITKDAVKNAFVEPRAIDMDLVDAQQARRVLDRIVGYSISPLLWKKVKERSFCRSGAIGSS